MQAKMMKPQMVQFGISFVYLIVWFLVLTPYFRKHQWLTYPVLVQLPMQHIVGVQYCIIPVFYWYPICSLFFGLLSSRIIGIMPIEQV